MNAAMKILKINGLSLLALPLLLVATFCKLLAKAFEKITIFLAIGFFALVLIVLLTSGLTPKNLLQFLAVIVGVVAVFGVSILVFSWILSAISGVMIVIWNAIISLFDSLYEICYNRYLSLFTSCEADYRILSINGKKVPNAIACIFFTILKGLSWLITMLVSLSYVVAGIFSVGLVILTLISENSTLKHDFGMNLIQYTQHCQLHSILFGIFLYLVIVGIIIVGVMALASEWYEWGQELRMTSKEISKEVTDLVKSDLKMATGSSEEVAGNLNYLKKLEEHLDSLEPLSAQVTSVLDQKDNPLLRSYWGIYMRNLNPLVDECSDKKSIDIRRFKQLIPQIQMLDKQRDDVQKLVKKLASELEKPSGVAVFFSGCDTLDKLEKRYKNLCKAYHPDIAEGDTETFQKMQSEYQSLKASLSAPVKSKKA